MTFYEFLNQIYTSSPDWIKALLIVSTGVFSLGVIITAVRFILSWRALSLSRDEIRRINTLSLDETNQSDQPRQPPHPFTAPDDDPNFPLAKPEDYAPFNEPYPDDPAPPSEGDDDQSKQRSEATNPDTREQSNAEANAEASAEPVSDPTSDDSSLTSPYPLIYPDLDPFRDASGETSQPADVTKEADKNKT